MIETLGGLFPPDDGPVVLDGAMGSELRARGWPSERLTHLASVDEPDLVEAIHAEHIAAGARLIATNTFSCTIASGPEYDAAVLDASIDASVAAARRAAAVHEAQGGHAIVVAGSLSAWNAAEHATLFARAVERLAAAGVDVLLFETAGTLADVRAALDVAEAHGRDLPVVVCCTTTDGSAHEHRRLAEISDDVDRRGGAVFGLNCCCGPHDLLRLITDLPRVPAWVSPNTGPPGARESDDTMAAFARAAVEAGARFVGGCCGTTPRTLQTMAAAIAR